MKRFSKNAPSKNTAAWFLQSQHKTCNTLPRTISRGRENMKLKVMALVFLLGIVGRVDAVFITGNTLLSRCESNSREQDDCLFYLMGIADSAEAFSATGFMSTQFCPSRSVTVQQLRKIFIKFANENPEHLDGAAVTLVHGAFIYAFPCK
jgi:hypothetical protein